MDTTNATSKKKNLAEKACRIVIGDFGKRILYPAQHEPLPSADGGVILKGKEGKFVVENEVEKLQVSYSVEISKDFKKLNVWFTKDPTNASAGTSQEITLVEDTAPFGVRPFFQCECGKNSTVFYKPVGQDFFRCRQCSNIIYESQALNRNTMAGAIYQTHKLIKLAKKEERVKRRFYGNKFTKGWQSFLKWKARWGFGLDPETIRFIRLQMGLAANEEK